MKRTLRMFGLMLCTILLCVGFTACGDNDDDVDGGLAGTTWKIISCSQDEGAEDDMAGTIVKFQSDGNVKLSPNNGWTYAKWTDNNGYLKIVMGEGSADDFMAGNYTISGSTMTWQYHWGDADGEWEDTDDVYTMVLQKQ